MKKALMSLILVLSPASFANSLVASDMATLLTDSQVQEFLGAEDVGNLKSVTYVGTARCKGGPSRYELVLQTRSADGVQICKKSVIVGECGVSGLRTKVEMAEGLSCE